MTSTARKLQPAVEVNGGPAGFVSRTLAAIVDYFFWFPAEMLILVVLRKPLGLQHGDYLQILSGNGYRAGLVVPTLFAQFGFIFYLGIADGLGGSVGKRAMRLRVIHYRTGRRAGIPRAFLRQILARTLSLWLCGFGFLSAFWQPDRRTWHDLASATQVVRARSTRTVSGFTHATDITV